jgi:diguanylate cyclase (GGDEF)-like protein
VNLVRFLIISVLSSLAATGAGAADREALANMLGEAERIRSADKPRSRQLLNEIERQLAADPDARLVARAQLLECNWADDLATVTRAFEAGLAAAQKAGELAVQSKLYACRAGAQWSLGRELDAERDYTIALDLARKAGDAASEADWLNHIGSIRYSRGAMASALEYLQSAYRTNVRLGREKERLDTLSNIANVYADRQVAQYDRALEYYRQLVEGYEKHGQPNDVADTIFNIGQTSETKGDFAAAEFNYRRALVAFERLGRADDIAFTRRALGGCLVKLGRPGEALPLLDAALTHYQTERDPGQLATARQYRGIAYRRLGRSAEAIRDLSAARPHFEAEKNSRFLERNIDETAIAYEQLGDWRNAYEFRKRHGVLQQELASARRDELSSRLRVEFDVEKKEQENRALARENALRAGALREAERNQRLQIIVIALTLLLAGALAALFWRQVANTRRMRAMAMTDELTRLPNRRHILTALEVAFDAAKRDASPITVIAFDIDRFKRINDTWGHAAGDAVLRTVAHTCRQALRPSDLIGRTGGEEFLIVLHDATPDQARDVAERLRTAVEALDFSSSVAEGLEVTISLGVFVSSEGEPHAAIAAADSLLYRAKESGRNRVEMDVAAA